MTVPMRQRPASARGLLPVALLILAGCSGEAAQSGGAGPVHPGVDAVFADLEDLTLEAEVRWQRAVELAGTWQNGLEFTRPLPREAEPILTGLLARLEE